MHMGIFTHRKAFYMKMAEVHIILPCINSQVMSLHRARVVLLCGTADGNQSL